MPFGQYILRYLPDPFGWDKIGSVAANIIAERTKANGNSKAHVSSYPASSRWFSNARMFSVLFLLSIFNDHNGTRVSPKRGIKQSALECSRLVFTPRTKIASVCILLSLQRTILAFFARFVT